MHEHTPEVAHWIWDPGDLVARRSAEVEFAHNLVEPEHAIGILPRSLDHTNRTLPLTSSPQEPLLDCFHFGSDPGHRDPVALVVHCYYSHSNPVELREWGLMPMGTVGRGSEAGSQQSLH